MRTSGFERFVTTVGTNGTMVFPLLDARNAGIPTFIVGPSYRRNGIRFYARMPSVDEAERLPSPMGYDRRSVTFEPVLLYIDGPLPPHCTGEFHRVMSGKNRGKMDKKPLHKWYPLEDTAIYPAAQINIPTLRPDETIEFEGSSYWYNPKQATRTVSQRPSMYRPYSQPEPPPSIESQRPVSLMLLVKLKWLPNDVKKKNIQVVEGSPIDFVNPPQPLAPEAPVPDIEVPNRSKKL
jgi:hypothetical protein